MKNIVELTQRVLLIAIPIAIDSHRLKHPHFFTHIHEFWLVLFLIFCAISPKIDWCLLGRVAEVRAVTDGRSLLTVPTPEPSPPPPSRHATRAFHPCIEAGMSNYRARQYYFLLVQHFWGVWNEVDFEVGTSPVYTSHFLSPWLFCLGHSPQSSITVSFVPRQCAPLPPLLANYLIVTQLCKVFCDFLAAQ